MCRSGQADRTESLKSVGEIEAAVGRAVLGFLQETYGRGAREMRVHLHRDTVYVMLMGVMAEPQRRLLDGNHSTECASLLKQFRERVLNATMDRLKESMLGAIGVRPKVVLHDFLPETGDEMFVFHLDGIPSVRT